MVELYCVRCRKKQKVKGDITAQETEKGSFIIKAECSGCNNGITQFAGKDSEVVKKAEVLKGIYKPKSKKSKSGGRRKKSKSKSKSKSGGKNKSRSKSRSKSGGKRRRRKPKKEED